MSIMPLYNIIALPGAKLWLQTSAYRELTGKEPVAGERVTLLMQKQEQSRTALDADSFRPIGVVGSVGAINAGGFWPVVSGWLTMYRKAYVNWKPPGGGRVRGVGLGDSRRASGNMCPA